MDEEQLLKLVNKKLRHRIGGTEYVVDKVVDVRNGWVTLKCGGVVLTFRLEDNLIEVV